jgi:hypothetical protein
MDPYTAHTIIRDATIIALAAIAGIGFPMARAYGRRLDRGNAGNRASLPSGETSEARLDRIERAVEAVALEVERMAEGQRFMTKLLAEPPRLKPPDEGQ